MASCFQLCEGLKQQKSVHNVRLFPVSLTAKCELLAKCELVGDSQIQSIYFGEHFNLARGVLDANNANIKWTLI